MGPAWARTAAHRRTTADPDLHTDFPFAALGEELGLVGILAILGLYLVVIERGLRIAAAAADDFRALLAAGLSLVVGVRRSSSRPAT